MELSVSDKTTMNSYFFLKNIVNPARLEAGENKVRNDDFLRRVEDEIDDLGGCEIFAAHGNEIKYYNLTVDQMMLVGMRESKAVRKSVLAKLKELEKPKQIAIPQTLSEALQLAADQARQLEEQAPKVSFFDTVAKNEHCFNATQVAQKFGLGVVTFNRYLMELGIYNKSTTKKTFKQDFINKGLGEMKMTSNGFSQAVFTVKGQQYLHELLTSEGII